MFYESHAEPARKRACPKRMSASGGVSPASRCAIQMIHSARIARRDKFPEQMGRAMGLAGMKFDFFRKIKVNDDSPPPPVRLERTMSTYKSCNDNPLNADKGICQSSRAFLSPHVRNYVDRRSERFFGANATDRSEGRERRGVSIGSCDEKLPR